MKYSIKKQMIAIFIGLLACMVVALLVINMTFLEPYYIQNKEKSFREMYETLNQVAQDQSYSDEEVSSDVAKQAERNNLSFLIIDETTGNKYTNVYNQEMLFNQLLGYVINQSQQNAEILESTDAYQMLQAKGIDIKGKTVAISGFGNVAWGSAWKLQQLGAKCVTISGPDGYIYDPDGVTAGEKEDYLLELRASGKNICAPYAEKFPGATFYPGKKPWEVKADLYIPCATQNEIRIEDAKTMVENGCKYLCEGSNMPTTNEAIEYLKEHNVVIGPSKAANAGGVACSCIEMGQNAGHTVFSPAQVYEQLETIMVNIHKNAADACERYGLGYDLVAGANIAGFEKVAEAMMAQGIV